MLENYGKFRAVLDTFAILALAYLSVTVGGIFPIGGLVLYTALVIYRLKTAAETKPTTTEAATQPVSPVTSTYSAPSYTPSYAPAPTQPVVINNTTSHSGSDFVMGMALGSMLSHSSTAPAAAASTTIHHVYDTPPKTGIETEEPTMLAPITSQELDEGVRYSPTTTTRSYGEALSPITSEELDSRSSSSSWSSSSDSSWGSSSSDSGSSYSSSSSDWGSSSSDSGSSSWD